MKTDTDRAVAYATKTFGREPPRGRDVEEVLALLGEVRRDEEQKLSGDMPAPDAKKVTDEDRACRYVLRRMPNAFPNGWLVDDLVALLRTVRRDARRKHQRSTKGRAA